MTQMFPHERRIRNYGFVTLALALALALALVVRGNAELVGIDVPKGVQYALVLAAVAVQVAALLRRSGPLATGASVLFVLSVVPAATDAAWLDYVLGAAFGVAVLGSGELVHMMERYERAHRAVDDDNVPEDHINKVTDESLRTLVGRGGVALACVLGAVAVAYLLRAAGPAQWRAAVETTAPLGVAVIALALSLVVAIVVLLRGARLPRYARTPRPEPQESTSDVPE